MTKSDNLHQNSVILTKYAYAHVHVYILLCLTSEACEAEHACLFDNVIPDSWCTQGPEFVI